MVTRDTDRLQMIDLVVIWGFDVVSFQVVDVSFLALWSVTALCTSIVVTLEYRLAVKKVGQAVQYCNNNNIETGYIKSYSQVLEYSAYEDEKEKKVDGFETFKNSEAIGAVVKRAERNRDKDAENWYEVWGVPFICYEV